MIEYPEETNVSLVAWEPRSRQSYVTISKKPEYQEKGYSEANEEKMMRKSMYGSAGALMVPLQKTRQQIN